MLRLQVPGLAPAQPGQFIHLTCGPDLTLPRPFSILDSDSANQTIDLLYRVTGEGTQRMTTWQTGFVTPVLGPIGHPFTVPPTGTQAILVAGGVGLAPLDFLARQLAAQGIATTVLWGIETDPPFPVEPDPVQGWSVLSHLHARGIPSRLAAMTPRVGFFQGTVVELAADHLQPLTALERKDLMLYTCGPTPMMAALALVAERFGLRGEASLEARMACGFGACVGCVALMAAGQYRRVCVDGPVFALAEVDWRQRGL
ncbi:MAG: dihydroorotate dehydrogenase electron transfer subunit [Magnetococcales bacterium]|nr:dihydroorotate dehydrogenase electron transfer subunit [Magnetococcales bacterium]